ncbi:MAG: PHP domain-containing protein [Vallitaleaceae bacterium]|jgi:predicted metal-dependent phosphoesterase TrpH|nr:PHP domain-containing protein [Vallitaleaceae bacterium]
MIDLHVHSYISDGSDRPADIISKAKELGISAIALTDHDTIDGLEEADEAAKKVGITLIKGIELSVDYGNGRLLHILGLGIEPKNPVFSRIYTKYKTDRHNALPIVIEQLQKKGFPVVWEELLEFQSGNWLDRQAIAKWLVKYGHATSISSAWIEIIDLIGYESGELISLEDALLMIKLSGGLSFLAHYNKLIGFEGYTAGEIETSIAELKVKGLDGIERYYPTFTKENHEELDYLIERYELLSSGGTDYHGLNRLSIQLGVGEGDFSVDDAVYEKLKPHLSY